jgi:cell division transport system permease protein
VARAVELARASPGVAGVRALTKAESERLLEPWLGVGLDLGDLPVPRLILVGLADRSRSDLSELRRRLARRFRPRTGRPPVVAVAAFDYGRHSGRSWSGLVALVLAAAGLATAFATRGAMAGNRDAVDVLHFVGAQDRFIAAEFQRRFFRLGLKGGILGGGAALGLIALLGIVTRRWGESAAGDQIEALFGTFNLGWRGAAAILAVIGVVAIVHRPRLANVGAAVLARRRVSGVVDPRALFRGKSRRGSGHPRRPSAASILRMLDFHDRAGLGNRGEFMRRGLGVGVDDPA